MNSAYQQIMVPFSGDGAGVEELTWGQRDIWRMMRASGTPRMVGGARPVAPGTTIEHLARVLSFVMSRHQSLRTRIRLDQDGTPRQVVAAAGEVALEIVDTAGTDGPAEVAEAVRARFTTEPFDTATQWPVRMAVVRHHGRPSHFVVMYPHIAIDGYGFDALIGDLAKLDRDSGEHLAPRSGVQPLDLARLQRTPAARRQSATALIHWERLLDASPPRQFHGSAEQRHPRCWEATYDSRAAFLALTVLAARLRIHSGAILMAAYATALGRVTGIPTRLIRTQVSNRFRPGFALSVSTLVQPGLCLIDTDCPFPEAAARAWQSQLTAARHAYYDPADLQTLLEAFPARDPLSYFNDRRRAPSPPGSRGPVPTTEEILAALPRSTLTPGVRFHTPDTTTYLNVDRSETSLKYTLRVDTAALTPGDQATILRGIEEILTRAATAESPDAKPRRSVHHRHAAVRHGRDPAPVSRQPGR